MHSLVWLKLDVNCIGDDGCEAVCSVVRGTPRLQLLALDGQRHCKLVGRDSLVAGILAALAALPKLVVWPAARLDPAPPPSPLRGARARPVLTSPLDPAGRLARTSPARCSTSRARRPASGSA